MDHAIILGYHRIVSHLTPDVIGRRLQVTAENFARQIDALCNRFEVVSLFELATRIISGLRVGGLAAVTFDDGYEDNFTNAFPILQTYAIPATIFLITDTIESRRSFWTDRLASYIADSDGMNHSVLHMNLLRNSHRNAINMPGQHYRHLKLILSQMDNTERLDILNQLGAPELVDSRPLNWPQVQVMHRGGVQFGAHTHDHPKLPGLSRDRLYDQITKSRCIIESNLGTRVNTFAYPFGEFNDEVALAVKDAGFLCAVRSGSALCSNKSDLFRLPRHRVTESNSIELANSIDRMTTAARH
jgi:peptidoglycan/xylan/chitin deacetylase (PgdA/CDA1 family)